MTIRT